MKVIQYTNGVEIRTEEAMNRGLRARNLNPKAYNAIVNDFVSEWGMELSQEQTSSKCAMVGDFGNGIYFHENDTGFMGDYARSTYYMDFMARMEKEYESKLNG